MKFFKKKDRRKAILIALLFHAVLIVLFNLFGMYEPDPLPEPEEVLVELSWAGSASISGSAATTAAETVAATPAQEVPTQEDESVDIPVSTNDVAPPNPDPVPDPNPEPDPEPEPTVSDELGQASTSVWDTPGEGEGPDSEEQADGQGRGRGTLGGLGGGWSLDGRDFIGGDVSTSKPDEEGIVVLKIWVGRDGKVSRSSPDLSNSTTTSQHLISLAQQAAKRARFNVDNSAQVEQLGRMTFVFELE